MMRFRRLWVYLAFALSVYAPALAGDMNLEVESGAVWFSRNDNQWQE